VLIHRLPVNALSDARCDCDERICARSPPFQGLIAIAPPLVAALVTRPARPLLSTHRFGDPRQLHVVDDRISSRVQLGLRPRIFSRQFVHSVRLLTVSRFMDVVIE
jgi:hypothetical protein